MLLFDNTYVGILEQRAEALIYKGIDKARANAVDQHSSRLLDVIHNERYCTVSHGINGEKRQMPESL